MNMITEEGISDILSYIKKEVELARKPFMKLSAIFNTIDIFDKKK